MEFKLSENYIELIKLLKRMQLAQTGGHARILVEEGAVNVNGEVEFRKRRKLVAGDLVECEKKTVKIIGRDEDGVSTQNQ